MFRNNRYRWVTAAAVALFLLAVGGVWLAAIRARDLADPAAARRNGQPIPVRTALAREVEVADVAGATALTVPSMTVSVRVGPSRAMSTQSPIADMVMKDIHVQEGTAVEQGQLLAELEDDGLRQAYKEKEAIFTLAKAELQRMREQVPLNEHVRALDLTAAETQVRFSREEFGNRKTAYEAASRLLRDKAGTLLDYWDARSKYANAEFGMTKADFDKQKVEDLNKVGKLADERDLAKALSMYETARFDLEMAGRDLERCQLRSPITGWVNKMTLIPGSVVNVTQMVAEVVKLDPLHVRLDFPQERIDQVAVGQNAEITLDSFPQETFTGKVVRVLPSVNPNLRVLPVIVEMSNTSQRVKAGLSGFVRLRTTRKALTVPAVAVQQQGGKAVVFTVDNGHAHLREVTVGTVLPSGDQEVRQGLKDGEEVVIYQSNFYRHYGQVASRGAFLQDNDPVDTNWKKWARRDD